MELALTLVSVVFSRVLASSRRCYSINRPCEDGKPSQLWQKKIIHIKIQTSEELGIKLWTLWLKARDLTNHAHLLTKDYSLKCQFKLLTIVSNLNFIKLFLKLLTHCIVFY